MKSLKLFVVFLLWLLQTLPAAIAAQNVLLLIADDYGADSSSLYNNYPGASLPPTPNIAALAQSGVLFRNGYGNPVCSPSRACLITGRHSFRTGVGDVIMGAGSSTLAASEFTIAEAFAANAALNYQVGAFGKWHLANALNSPGTIGGWPHFAGSLSGGIASFTNWTKVVNGISTANYTNYATTDIVDDVIAWTQSKGTNHWFAWVAFNAPHTPLHKPPSTLCPSYAALSGTTQNINANPRQYFEAMVEAMDTEIGRLLSAIDRTNTHIIFVGDNGTPGNVIQPPYSNTRAKDTLYEGGVRVPFVIAGPAVSNPGRTNDTPVHLVDLYSTILELAGIDVATTVPSGVKMDSQSLVPLLQDDVSLARHVLVEVFGANTPANDGRALRNGQFKLIQFSGTGTEQFYDVLNDPSESTNLLAGTMSAAQQANYHALLLRLGGYTTVTQPAISSMTKSGTSFSASVPESANQTYELWRSANLLELSWAPVADALVVTNNGTVTLSDLNAATDGNFYLVLARDQE